MLKEILSRSIKKWHGRDHYPYQKAIADAIIDAVVESQNGTQTYEIPIEIPRQAGKTTSVVDTVEVLLAASRRYLKRPLTIGIFAPQKEQASTDFERLKLQFIEISKLGFKTKVAQEGDLKFPDKWNSKTIRIFNSKGDVLGEVYIFPISKTSNPESKTLDVIIVEEAQDVDDEKMKNSIFPMGASTNAPRIYIGTAGTRLCYFKNQLDTNPRKIRITLPEVFAQRRAVHAQTGNPFHLNYEQYVSHEMQTHGEKSDYVQRQYFLVWKIGSGQFCSAQALSSLVGEHGIIDSSKDVTDRKGNVIDSPPVFVGIDTAKSPDQTVVTVIRNAPDEIVKWMAEHVKDPYLLANAAEDDELTEYLTNAQQPGFVKNEDMSQLCNWLTLPGANYEDQFEAIVKFLEQYDNIMCIAIDSTGQGDFMPDKFERHTHYKIMRIKFSLESKDALYKNLLQVIRNFKTTLPNIPFDEGYLRFRKEIIELEKEYKGSYMSVHHPKTGSDGKPGHDDYPDSWALAEYARADWIKNQPTLSFL